MPPKQALAYLLAEKARRTKTKWKPQPGPQTALLNCKIKDIFFGGARGGGKTDGVVGFISAHGDKYGEDAKAIIFRKSYKELEEVELTCNRILVRNGWKKKGSEGKTIYTAPNGATCKLRHLDREEDADDYQGHQYTVIAPDELGNWASPVALDKLRACLRSAAGVPCYYISTGNPGGVGHNWVKARYISPSPPGVPFYDEEMKIWRIFIPSKIEDNRELLDNDPEYIDRLYSSGPAWLVRAWLEGDWDIVAGGFLEEIWDHKRHVVKPFKIPDDWKRWRALDWGFAAPYSVGWYALDPVNRIIYRYRELYGDGGKPNVGTRESAAQVAAKIKEIEADEVSRGIKFTNNPADSAIWNNDGREITVAELFYADPNKISWSPSKKGKGSRKNQNQVVIQLLTEDRVKVFNTCTHFIRTVPVLLPDKNDPEDVDTDMEDHVWDEFKYSLASRHKIVLPEKVKEDIQPFTPEWVLYEPESEKARSKYRP